MDTSARSLAPIGTFLIAVAALVFILYLVADRSSVWPLFAAATLVFLGAMLRIESAIRSCRSG